MKETREEFIIVEAITAAAKIASTMFEAKGKESEYHPDEMKRIANAVLKKTTKWQLENLWTICGMPFEYKGKQNA